MSELPHDAKQRLYDRTTMSDEESCWLWLGPKAGGQRNRGASYGVVSMGKRKDQRYAHRLSYEIHIGPIPPGMNVLHTCDTPLCVNPYHLFLGTQKDNAEDMVAKGRHNYGERCTTSKLTEDDVRSIRRIRRDGSTLATIAGQFGISSQHVSRIVHGTRWAHVSEEN